MIAIGGFSGLAIATKSYQSVAEACRSDVYLFVVGVDKDEFYVHAIVLATISEPFKAIFTRLTREYATKRILLEDVDVQTFGSVLDFAYKQMYEGLPSTTPEDPDDLHKRFGGVRAICSLETEHRDAKYCVGCGGCFSRNCSEECEYYGRSRSHNCPVCGAPHEAANTSYTNNIPVLCAACIFSYRFYTPFKDRQYLIGGLQSSEDISEHPSHHAKIYTFANKWRMNDLKALCLHKLHKDLCEILLYDETVGSICETIREIYENTSKTADDDARDLIAGFSATCFDKLVEFEAFNALTAEDGDFVPEMHERLAKLHVLQREENDRRLMVVSMREKVCTVLASSSQNDPE